MCACSLSGYSKTAEVHAKQYQLSFTNCAIFCCFWLRQQVQCIAHGKQGDLGSTRPKINEHAIFTLQVLCTPTRVLGHKFKGFVRHGPGKRKTASFMPCLCTTYMASSTLCTVRTTVGRASNLCPSFLLMLFGTDSRCVLGQYY